MSTSAWLSELRKVSLGLTIGLFSFFVADQAAATLTFQDETVEAYYSAQFIQKGACNHSCGATDPCWTLTQISGSQMELSAYYGGPGPCTWGSCCLEAGGLLTGVIRIILYVDAQTGLPRSRFSGGRPVIEGIPPGTKIVARYQDYLARAQSCIAAYCDAGCTSEVGIAVAGQAIVLSQARPICGPGLYITEAFLTKNAAAFIGITSLKANNGSVATATVRLPPLRVDVPGNQLFPDPETAVAPPSGVFRISNETWGDWDNLTIQLYDRNGALVETLASVGVPALSTLEWSVAQADPLGSIRAIATSASRRIVPLPPTLNSLTYGTFPTSPHILVDQLVAPSAGVPLRLSNGRRIDACRAGWLRAELGSIEAPGYTIVPNVPVGPVSTEFDEPTLASAWAVVNPSAPSSSVSLTQRPGFLRIVATAAGEGADLWAGTNFRAPRVTQIVEPGGDWTLETAVEFSPSDDYEGAGVLIDDSRDAELAFSPNGAGRQIRCFGGYAPFPGNRAYVRIVKEGTLLRGYWSANGVNWNTGGTKSATPTCVGLFVVRKDWVAGNAHNAIADFDYFHFDRVTAVSSPQLPSAYKMSLAPNPFDDTTRITFFASEPQDMHFSIYDVRGRLVRVINIGKINGEHAIIWDGKNDSGVAVTSGVYFARLSGRTGEESMKILRTR